MREAKEQLVNVKITSFYSIKIDELIKAQKFSSRAECVREALRLLFQKEGL
jgi:Arc/MetJ-type ribon-helix-helix transcriptional regulator